jgi:hypothetical protein
MNEVLNETSKKFVNLLEDNRLICPVCSFTYNHVQKVGTELDPGGDETCIYAGTSLVFERHTGERRSAVRIDIMGECGHNWSLILQQHKGEIYVHLRERASDSNTNSLELGVGD